MRIRTAQNLQVKHSGQVISEVYFARPLTRSKASILGCRVPIILNSELMAIPSFCAFVKTDFTPFPGGAETGVFAYFSNLLCASCADPCAPQLQEISV